MDAMDRAAPPAVVGVCAMDVKVKAKPMQEILTRMKASPDVKLIYFGDDLLLNKPVEEWPVVDILVAFHSDHFPLAKVIRYVDLRRPFCINELKSYYTLFDRAATFDQLQAHGVPVPEYVLANRDPKRGALSIVEEEEDLIRVDGRTLHKPFVEKPVEGEDHNVWVHYASYQGGGIRKLFRKVNNTSSLFYPHESGIRKEGTFIYEEYFEVDDNADIKVYCVLPNYILAQRRKSPTIDGIVQRAENGREVRELVPLTSREREIAFSLGRAFQNRVYGFDILRVDGKSYVCDVNGWSFVKGVPQYYDHCSRVLTRLVRQAKSRMEYNLRVPHEPSRAGEKLMGVIAITRHGDRAPKQKVKETISSSRVLALFGDLSRDFTVKKENDPEWCSGFAKSLQDLLDSDESKTLVPSDLESLRMIVSIMERGPPELKLQVKPRGKKKSSSSGITRANWALVVLKWGGYLTHAGVAQARSLGERFRETLTAEKGQNIFENLAISSNSERRVLRTAQEFTKALLKTRQFSGQLVTVDNEMLEKRSPEIEKTLKDIKERLSDVLLSDKVFGTTAEDYADPVVQYLNSVGLAELGNPMRAMKELHQNLLRICRDVEHAASEPGIKSLCENETLSAAAQRWRKSVRDLYNKETDTWDTTRISQVFDMLKFDAVHHNHVLADSFVDVYRQVQRAADLVIPQGFGIGPTEKVKVGYGVAARLLNSILSDIDIMSNGKPFAHFYFTEFLGTQVITLRVFYRLLHMTGECHIHALLNLLMYGLQQTEMLVDRSSFIEINYMAHIVFMVYRGLDGTSRIEMSVSTGASDDVFQPVGKSHHLPVEFAVTVHEHIQPVDLKKILSRGINERERLQTGSLKGIVGVIRHGDRTTKQKMRISTRCPALVEFIVIEENGQDSFRRNQKKHPEFFGRWIIFLQKLVDESHFSETEVVQVKLMLAQLRSGAAGAKIQASVSSGVAKVVLKWGGVQTHAGLKQGYQLGKTLRDVYLPEARSERLSFYEGLNAVSNNETRVQETMEAFLQGLLEDEPGEIVEEVLRSRVETNSALLSETPAEATHELELERARVQEVLLSGELPPRRRQDASSQAAISLVDDGLMMIPNPKESLDELRIAVEKVCDQLKSSEASLRDEDVCGAETVALMRSRWRKCLEDYHSAKHGYNVLKIPEVYENILFDLTHNKKIMPNCVRQAVKLARRLNAFVSPQEFGLRAEDKMRIGSMVAYDFFKKIIEDLEHAAFSPGRSMQLYFCSELLVHGLLNSISCSGGHGILIDRHDIGFVRFLSHFVFRIYEHDDSSFHVDILFSSGQADITTTHVGADHVVPVRAPLVMHDSLPLRSLHSMLATMRLHRAEGREMRRRATTKRKKEEQSLSEMSLGDSEIMPQQSV